MSYTEKYKVSKRGHEEGPYSAVEIIDLLRMKELSMIHKVQVSQEWIAVSDFLDKHGKGELPEQNIEKAFEEVEQEAAAKKVGDQEEEQPEPEPEPEPEPIEVPEPGPAVEIRVNRAGQEFGPYLIKEVKDYLKAGNLRFSDMVWFEGLPDWVSLSSVPGVSQGIETLGSAAPPPPKPPPAPSSAPPIPPAASPSPAGAAKSQSEDAEREFDPLTPEEEEDPETAGLAEFGPRILAGILDSLILWFVLGIIIGVVALAGSFDWIFWLAMFFVVILANWLYFALTESSKAMASPGKRILKLQVVAASTNSRIGFGRATGRAILKGLFNTFPLLLLVLFVTRRRQGLHDLACGTLVRAKLEDDTFEAPSGEDEEANGE